MNEIDILAPKDLVIDFFLNPEKVFRLNPSFFVNECRLVGEGLYEIRLYDDKSEGEITFVVAIERRGDSVSYRIQSERLCFVIRQLAESTVRVQVSGGIFRQEDIPFWLKGVKSYIGLERRNSRVVKGLLDRFWIRLTPSQRRITLIILMLEGIGLAALLVVILVMRFL
jgi:hypothetical protein